MHHFAGILDTRPRGSRHGVKRTCSVCQRKHSIWVCFREVELKPVPGKDNTVSYNNPTGKVIVTGTECAKKIQVPIWETFRVEAQLEDVQAHALHPGDARYDQLFKDFR